jgi:hypothetical protein
MTIRLHLDGATTFTITALVITTFSIMTLAITLFSITILRITIQKYYT